jgi:predicted dehydrogenase/threonine dehydrogenase-like Zn-dependent dehydrogenase
MKALSQNYKTGSLRIEDVDQPVLRPGGILVRTAFSVVSAGTELMKVREAKMNYLQKAKARPDQVKKVVTAARQQGVAAAYQKVMNKLDALTPLGYSTAGTVVAVGRGAEEFRIGQRVACGGAGYANHAEVNFVPKNLVVPVPDGVPLEQAAFATVGSIAMQGYRQAEMQLGETACVVGLGLIGQILCQILHAAGITVIGIDLSPKRCELAMEHAHVAFASTPDDPGLLLAVERLSGGAGGSDCVFIAAGGSGNEAVELAAELARDRGRIVDIGKTGLNLAWNDWYDKELDLRFSRSYGPGRYDTSYEEGGLEYPLPYVRWTERRNLQSFIDQIALGRLQLDYLSATVYDFEDAEHALDDMANGRVENLGVIFRYKDETLSPEGLRRAPTLPRGSVAPRPAHSGSVRMGFIGAGNYASSMLLPVLKQFEDVRLETVATRSSLSSADAARKSGFAHATTDHRSVLDNPDIDAVVVATRHASHAQLVSEALRTGKATFVEKPLAIDLEGLESVRAAMAESGNDRLLVGFNRRFSPMIQSAKQFLGRSSNPMVVSYRVHAGPLDHGSWYRDRSEGSRFVGEGGHFIDTCTFVIGSRPRSVFAASLGPAGNADDIDNLVVTITYEDGSLANIHYLSRGGSQVPKELLEIDGGGRTVRLENFKKLVGYDGDARPRALKADGGKGQAQQLRQFVSAVGHGSEMPISAESIFDTTLATIASMDSLRHNAPVELGTYWEA